MHGKNGAETNARDSERRVRIIEIRPGGARDVHTRGALFVSRVGRRCIAQVSDGLSARKFEDSVSRNFHQQLSVRRVDDPLPRPPPLGTPIGPPRASPPLPLSLSPPTPDSAPSPSFPL